MNKKKLFIGICIIILLVLGVFWFTSRHTPPRTHSVVAFNEQGVYTIAQGDSLTGKGVPSSFVFISFTPGSVSSQVAVDKSGKWMYVVPKELTEEKYQMTLRIFDKKNTLLITKTYHIQFETLIGQLFQIFH